MGMIIEGLDLVIKNVGKFKAGVKEAIVSVYNEVGAFIVEQIRNGSMSEWDNHTWKLRSSIGYAVGFKGELVSMSDFDILGDGEEGARKGRDFAEELIRRYSSENYVLVIVAGEEYAVYVEAVENKIVLSSVWFYIKDNIKELIEEKLNEISN